MGLALLVSGCGRGDHLGKPPTLTPVKQSPEQYAMMTPPLPESSHVARNSDDASLWSRNRKSLLGDRRAIRRGDILTVVIEMDENASIDNQSERSRSGSESMSVPQLFGIPQRIDGALPEGASMSNAVELGSTSSSSGDGSVTRSEKLTLQVAATIVDVLPNGVLSIQGSQEVRVNFELRELLVAGFVRPEDISRQNSISIEKIASARVSYGGRGQITDMQQPRFGQQVLDIVLPF
ncbi:MAG: flagellar basal body L-ring protein FlgH [Shimia sp.]|jgi:flagellar L-ring protein precursor FlgH|uniref:flagellar basal body L-ring protein FlgH n=1 Tax=unclassified Shimia TaxID=2630038 RepID=UPI00187CED51|nr:flagellar basal body L-ring protein FlgH [Shimia sp. SK013]